MKMLRSFACFCVMFFFCVELNAQEFSNKGKDFWLGYGYHVAFSGNTQDMVLYFTSTENASVKVEIPAVGYSVTYSVIANQVTVSQPIPKTGAQDARVTGPGTFNTGIHITSDKAVVAYAHIYNASVSGASLLFPTNTLGKEYYSVIYTQNSNSDLANSFFFVVATEDNTTVEITPSAANKNALPVGTPSYVTLNKGQIYSVLGTTAVNATGIKYTGTDLTGSRIRSVSNNAGGCKPIAVFSGSGKISIGGTNQGSADNLFAQAFPSKAWGLKYLTSPTGTQPNNYFRVCVKDPTTVVKLNGVALPAASLINGFYYEFKNAGGTTAATPNLIESDKPILVAQYCTTQGMDGNSNASPYGDPEMIYLSPVEQTINNITLYSANKNAILQSYINVIIKNGGINSFTLDGVKPLASAFKTHPGDAGYSYATFSVSSGASHTLYSDTGYNAIAYGFGSAESYGYNAGTNIIDLNPPVSIQNEYASTNITYSATCSNSPFKVNLSLPYQPSKIALDFNGTPNLVGTAPFTYDPVSFDSSYLLNGKTYYVYRVPASFKFNSSGTYPVKITTTSSAASSDGCGTNDQQELTDNIIVNDPPTVDFSITSNGCINSPVSFKDLTNGGRPVIKWIYDFGDGTSSVLQNPDKTYSAAGNYAVKLMAVSDFGCITTLTKTVPVSAKPVPSFSIPALTCVNNNIVITDGSTISPGVASNTIAKWKWNLDNGAGEIVETNSVNPAFTYTTWGIKDVTLVTESNTGCLSDTFRITPALRINPYPKVGYIIPEVCLADASAPFKDTTTIADGSEASFIYLWKLNDGLTPVTPSPSFSTSTLKDPAPKYNNFGNYTVSLRVTSNKGCIDSLSKSFTVNGSIPNPSFAVQQQNPLCSNDSIRIINTSTVDFGGVTRLDIYWDTIAAPGVKVPDESPANPKTYANLYTNFYNPASKNFAIKLVAFSGQSSSCSRSITKIITVNNSPGVSFSAMRGICLDAAPRQITQGSFVSALPAVGTYSGSGINTVGLLDPTIPGVGIDTLKYFVKNSAGCKDSAFKSIVVWPSPVAKWGVASPLCEKNNIAFTDSSVANYSNIATRNWIFGDNTSQTNTSNAVFVKQYAAANTYTATLKVITDSGCVSMVNQQTIKVNPLPKVNFTLPEICLPDGNGTFNDLSTITDFSEAGFLYKWNFGDPNDPSVSLLKNPVHRYTALGPYNVQLVITSKDGCVDSSTKSLTTVYPWPKANFVANPAEICLGDPIQFTDLGDGKTSAAVSWNWNLSGGTTSTLQNPVKQFNDSGTFTISYYFFNAQGCVSDTLSKQVVVHPYPVLDLIPSIKVLEGGSTPLKPLKVFGNNLVYDWSPATYLNNDTDSIPISTPLGDITYRLNLTGIGGCMVTDTVFIKVLLAPVIPNAFSPNGDGINDRWKILYLESYPGATIDVYNRYGQLIYSRVGYSDNWDGTVNGTPLPIGTYYYVLNPKNGRKIVTGSVTIIR